MTMSLHEATARLTAPGERFEVAETEVLGNKTRVWRHAPRSLREILEASREHGDKTWIVYEDERLSFEAHYQAVVALARRLVDRYGVAKGDRVAIAMRNYPEWSVAFWAITALGAIAVPLNAWWRGEELAYGLTDSGSCVLIADEERWLRLQELEGSLPDLAVRLICRPSSAADIDGAESLEEIFEDRNPSAVLPAASIGPEDDATIFYTSGTTGFPKGALGTHRNICSNQMTLEFQRVRAELRSGAALAPGTQPANLLSVPLFHVTGCHSTLVPCLALGAKLVLMYRFDADRAVELLERERITSFGGVPTLVWKVLECESLGRCDTSSVLRVGYGGAPAAPELVRRIKEVFPQASPANGYGLTESSALSVSNAGEEYLARPGSVGLPVPVCEVKVMDPEGEEELLSGAVGELWIRGPNIIKGYWNKPEATAETFVDGWLRSGDLASLDDEGYVTIVDRAKDMVIRGGENIYCVEVEAKLFEHPEILDAAVFGVPHRVLGEELAAVVQVRQGAGLTGDGVRAHLSRSLAAFKVPTYVELSTEDFPRNANGKTMKSQLRAEMLDNLAGDRRNRQSGRPGG